MRRDRWLTISDREEHFTRRRFLHEVAIQARARPERLQAGDCQLIAIHTPGHASNCVCYLLEREQLLFTGYGDGTFVAYDDENLEPLWKINVGSGFNAPPMTFEVGGKQYVAILAGLSQISKGRLTLTPELREMRNQTMLFVFGL